MGRPPVLPKKKKDGFYLELRNKGAKTGIIIIRDTREAMMQAVKQYQNTKDVIILGEHRNGKKVEESGKAAKKSAQRLISTYSSQHFVHFLGRTVELKDLNHHVVNERIRA